MDDVSRCTKENGKRIDRWRRHIVTTHRVVSPSILLVLAESRCLSFFVPLLSRRLPSPSGTNVLGYGPRFSRRASYKWPLHAGLKYIYIYVCAYKLDIIVRRTFILCKSNERVTCLILKKEERKKIYI